MFPKLKKEINAFLTQEDGAMSKETILKTGIIVAALSIASAKDVKADHAVHTNSYPAGCEVLVPQTTTVHTNNEHGNSLQLNQGSEGISGTHAHCAGHTNGQYSDSGGGMM